MEASKPKNLVAGVLIWNNFLSFFEVDDEIWGYGQPITVVLN